VATSDLKKVFAFSNLSKAWKWIKSNPEPNYKNYFRPIYTAYAAAEDSYLKSLQLRLSRGTYTPTPATKIFVPKPSGILRPITLLNIEDQIVYQAFANLVAERLSQRIKKRYYTEIFGHIYAGSSSNFFYKDWRKGQYSDTYMPVAVLTFFIRIGEKAIKNLIRLLKMQLHKDTTIELLSI